MKRFKNILLVADPISDTAESLKRALQIVEENQAELKIVATVHSAANFLGLPEGGPVSSNIQDVMIREKKEEISNAIKGLDKYKNIQIKVLVGDAFVEVVNEVIKGRHDLLIKMAEAPDWMDRIFGSEDMHFLRKCPCPVWIIKPGATKPYKRIMAAVDVALEHPENEREKRGELAAQILEIASSLALSEFAELHVVHVWTAHGEAAMRGALMKTPEAQVNAYVSEVKLQHENAFQKMIMQLERKIGVEASEYLKLRTHVINGLPRKDLVEAAKKLNADLLVMGTVGRTGIPGFIMGNTAESVLNQVSCSVLALKPDGFISPVVAQR